MNYQKDHACGVDYIIITKIHKINTVKRIFK